MKSKIKMKRGLTAVAIHVRVVTIQWLATMILIVEKTFAETMHVLVRVYTGNFKHHEFSRLVPVTCSDGIKNQNETDIDCGGLICSKCNNTMACKNNSDCISNSCENRTCVRKDQISAISCSKGFLILVHETCNDGLNNQDETDIDCGGIVCSKCNNTRVCQNNSDCISNICKNNICARKEIFYKKVR